MLILMLLYFRNSLSMAFLFVCAIYFMVTVGNFFYTVIKKRNNAGLFRFI